LQYKDLPLIEFKADAISQTNSLTITYARVSISYIIYHYSIGITRFKKIVWTKKFTCPIQTNLRRGYDTM